MPVGELIGAAIGIMLLIIVAYVVVGSVLVTSEITISAQKDVALRNEIRENTHLDIASVAGSFAPLPPSTNEYPVNLIIRNTGNEIIRDFTHMDIVAKADCILVPVRYNYTTVNTANGWLITGAVPGGATGIYIDDNSATPHNEMIHRGMLDPGEKMGVSFTVTCDTPTPTLTNVWVKAISENGATASNILSTGGIG